MAGLEAVDHDPFAGMAAIDIHQVDANKRVPAASQLTPVDHDPFATDYGGLAKQTGVGVAKGAIGLPGMLGDAQELLKKGVDYVASKLPPPSEPDEPTRKFMEKY